MKVKLLDKNCMLSKGYVGDAGWDLSVRLEDSIRLHSMCRATIPVGVAVELPEGCVGIVKGRSSVAQKGILVMEGVIDQGFRGEISVTVVNVGMNPITIEPHDRIAQLVVMNLSKEAFDLEVVDKLEESPRGEKGFGSTGKR
jgi:dUTP pyrophosphatase